MEAEGRPKGGQREAEGGRGRPREAGGAKVDLYSPLPSQASHSPPIKHCEFRSLSCTL